MRTPSYSIIRQLCGSIFAVVFPSACAMCAREMTTAGCLHVCPECRKRLGPWNGPACDRCGVPFASELAAPPGRAGELGAAGNPQVGLCGQCRTGAYEFDLARSYGLYRGDLRDAILQLKFKGRERLGLWLGKLLVSVCSSSVLEQAFGQDFAAGEPVLLIPVPLHKSRTRKRGFNQAELLARGLAKALCRPDRIPERDTQRLLPAGPGARLPFLLATHCLHRVRATPPQSGLSLAARRENVRGVFHTAMHSKVRGRNVVLIDDVMTTGATLSACAGVLKRAGANHVFALSLARATPQFPDALASARSRIGLPTN